MKLHWSYAVLLVRDLDNMLDFYTNVLLIKDGRVKNRLAFEGEPGFGPIEDFYRVHAEGLKNR